MLQICDVLQDDTVSNSSDLSSSGASHDTVDMSSSTSNDKHQNKSSNNDGSGDTSTPSSTPVSITLDGSINTPWLTPTDPIDSTPSFMTSPTTNGGTSTSTTASGFCRTTYHQTGPPPQQQQQQTNPLVSPLGRRAITATHNYTLHAAGGGGRQQQMPPPQQYVQAVQAKSAAGYATASQSGAVAGQGGAWQPGAGGNWPSSGIGGTGSTAAWSRGRSVPNMLPIQSPGLQVGRKPSPTFSVQSPNVMSSPVKFRRSTSYPGKGIFPANVVGQPQPTFEITNMDEGCEMLLPSYQVLVFLDCTAAQL